VNRRDFLISTALAAPTLVFYPVFNARGELVEILVVIVFVLVFLTITVLIYRAAKKLLYPPPPPPSNPPPSHHAPASTQDVPNVTLRAGDAAPMYNVSQYGWHMPDGSLCSGYVQVQLQSAPTLDGTWTDRMLARVYISGSQMIATLADTVVLAAVLPPAAPSIQIAADATAPIEKEFWRVKG
jgi:hypothetical protein